MSLTRSFISLDGTGSQAMHEGIISPKFSSTPGCSITCYGSPNHLKGTAPGSDRAKSDSTGRRSNTNNSPDSYATWQHTILTATPATNSDAPSTAAAPATRNLAGSSKQSQAERLDSHAGGTIVAQPGGAQPLSSQGMHARGSYSKLHSLKRASMPSGDGGHRPEPCHSAPTTPHTGSAGIHSGASTHQLALLQDSFAAHAVVSPALSSHNGGRAAEAVFGCQQGVPDPGDAYLAGQQQEVQQQGIGTGPFALEERNSMPDISTAEADSAAGHSVPFAAGHAKASVLAAIHSAHTASAQHLTEVREVMGSSNSYNHQDSAIQTSTGDKQPLWASAEAGVSAAADSDGDTLEASSVQHSSVIHTPAGLSISMAGSAVPLVSGTDLQDGDTAKSIAAAQPAGAGNADGSSAHELGTVAATSGGTRHSGTAVSARAAPAFAISNNVAPSCGSSDGNGDFRYPELLFRLQQFLPALKDVNCGTSDFEAPWQLLKAELSDLVSTAHAAALQAGHLELLDSEVLQLQRLLRRVGQHIAAGTQQQQLKDLMSSFPSFAKKQLEASSSFRSDGSAAATAVSQQALPPSWAGANNSLEAFHPPDKAFLFLNPDHHPCSSQAMPGSAAGAAVIISDINSDPAMICALEQGAPAVPYPPVDHHKNEHQQRQQQAGGSKARVTTRHRYMGKGSWSSDIRAGADAQPASSNSCAADGAALSPVRCVSRAVRYIPPCKDLTPEEAAQLAGLYKVPSEPHRMFYKTMRVTSPHRGSPSLASSRRAAGQSPLPPAKHKLGAMTAAAGRYTAYGAADEAHNVRSDELVMASNPGSGLQAAAATGPPDSSAGYLKSSSTAAAEGFEPKRFRAMQHVPELHRNSSGWAGRVMAGRATSPDNGASDSLIRAARGSSPKDHHCNPGRAAANRKSPNKCIPNPAQSLQPCGVSCSDTSSNPDLHSSMYASTARIKVPLGMVATPAAGSRQRGSSGSRVSKSLQLSRPSPASPIKALRLSYSRSLQPDKSMPQASSFRGGCHVAAAAAIAGRSAEQPDRPRSASPSLGLHYLARPPSRSNAAFNTVLPNASIKQGSGMQHASVCRRSSSFEGIRAVTNAGPGRTEAKQLCTGAHAALQNDPAFKAACKAFRLHRTNAADGLASEASARLVARISPLKTAGSKQVDDTVRSLNTMLQAHEVKLQINRLASFVYYAAGRKLQVKLLNGNLLVRTGGGYEDLLQAIGKLSVPATGSSKRPDMGDVSNSQVQQQMAEQTVAPGAEAAHAEDIASTDVWSSDEQADAGSSQQQGPETADEDELSWCPRDTAVFGWGNRQDGIAA